MNRGAIVLLSAISITACGASPSGISVALPDGNIGIGFDDLRYSASLHQVLVPAGRTGCSLSFVRVPATASPVLGATYNLNWYCGGMRHTCGMWNLPWRLVLDTSGSQRACRTRELSQPGVFTDPLVA